MKLIESRPSRLHCEICKDTYNLPQNGLIKTFKELKCPLDEFELVQFSGNNNGKVNFSIQKKKKFFLFKFNSFRVFPYVHIVLIIHHLMICIKMLVVMNVYIQHVVIH
jgi:hypothetical protein